MAKRVVNSDMEDLEFEVGLPLDLPTEISDNTNKNSGFNPLTKERVIVRHVPKETGIVTNPKHILYGGLAETAVRYYTVKQLESGQLTNVLTDSEKNALEEIMGLEYNSLSIYKKGDNNYWKNKLVRLTKQDNFLDLSSPDDYIKYKILLTNKDKIAPSLDALQNNPKITYEFVIIKEGEETSKLKKEMDYTMQAYMEFGKYQDDPDTLRTVIELLDGRPIAKNSKLEFLQAKVNKLIQSNTKTFISVITDQSLSNKVLIKKALEVGVITNKGNYLYYDNTPLCENGQEPTLSMAARYLGLPKYQNIKFSIEAKLKE